MSEIRKIVNHIKKQGYTNFLVWKGYSPNLSGYYVEEVLEVEGKICFKQIHLSGWQARPIPEILHIEGKIGKRGYEELTEERKKQEASEE